MSDFKYDTDDFHAIRVASIQVNRLQALAVPATLLFVSGLAINDIYRNKSIPSVWKRINRTNIVTGLFAGSIAYVVDYLSYYLGTIWSRR